MLNEQAYQHILRKIELGHLRPGDQVSARAIAKEVGVSFIPVREAIVRLTGDGLLDHRNGVGSFIAVPTRQDLFDMYQLRELLEGFAAEQAGASAALDTTAEMHQANEQMRMTAARLIAMDSDEWSPEDVEQWITGDRKFHRELLRSASNRAVMNTGERLRTMGMLSWTWRRRRTDDLLRSCDEHDQIVAGIRAGDGARAKRLVVAHIRRGRDQVMADFDVQRLQWTLP